jgi:ATP-dependent exoDNAse (exonuclease V) beta subunit
MVEVQPVEPDVDPVERNQTVQLLTFAVQPPDDQIGPTPHDLIDDSNFDVDNEETAASEGGETSFGDQVHQFAEDSASGKEVAPSNPHEERVKEFIDRLEGELTVEQPVRLPLEVDGGRVTISGVVDLVNLVDGRVEVIDYKTDATRRGHEEYRKQLSVYHHVLNLVFEDRDVFPSIYYTADDELVTVDPIQQDTLEYLVEETRV